MERKMQPNQRGPILILVGVILIVIDFTVLYWLPSLALSFAGICLICSGISATCRYNKAKSQYGQYQAPSYTQRPAQSQGPPTTVQEPEISYEPPESETPSLEEPTASHGFCPECGARATGKFCPECGSKID